jgi:hypothetical protein
MHIRRWRETDLPALHALNESAVPAVNSLSPAALRDLLEAALVAAVVESGKQEGFGDVVGFLICLPEGLDYASDNYRWFSQRYARFAYVDRVVVDSGRRGGGLGGALYGGLVRDLAGQRPVLTCEVNERPPNPASLRFHERFGFTPVGRQETEGGGKSVVLLAKSLAITA